MNATEILRAGDEIAYAENYSGIHYCSVPNARIGTELGRHESARRKIDDMPYAEPTAITIAKDIRECAERMSDESKKAVFDFNNKSAPKALTHDDGKPPLAHIPWDAIREMAHVQSYGQKKYGDFYNYKNGMELGRNLSCAIRHIAAFMDGEDLDKESQCSHLGHALCRVAFALQNIHDETAIDDRYKKLP